MIDVSDEITRHVVRLKEGADGWRRVDGPELTPEEPFLTGLPVMDAEELASRNYALRRATVEEARAFEEGRKPLPFDPEEYTVPALREALGEGSYTEAQLDGLAEAEEACQDRQTALDAIDEAR